MADKLLLRKGSLADLSNLPKVAGAISVTTDEGGIYLDINSTTRKRLGDFIPVDSLKELNDLAQEGLSETALYYAQEENVLARYSSNVNGKPGLVWINDTSELARRIANLETSDTNFTNIIDAIYGGTASLSPTATILSNKKAISDLKGNAETSGTVLGNQQAIINLTGDAQTPGTVLGNQQAISDLKGNAETSGTVLGNQQAITNLQQSISNIIGVGGNNYPTIAAGVAAANSYTDSKIDKLQEAINDTIASANSMTFRGVVTSLNNTQTWWTNTPVQAGDTYVVGAELEYSENDVVVLTCHVGDLLVAVRDEVASELDYPGGIIVAGEEITSDTGWYLISTGYDQRLENELTVGNNEIVLSSHTGVTLGQVSFSAPGSKNAPTNIQIETNGTDIQFNLVWVDF